jgi:hypothetical protein
METIPENGHRPNRHVQAATGPNAVFLSGFDTVESTTVTDILARIGFPDHRIVLCTAAMLSMSLEDALRERSPDTPVSPDALPRIVIVSGVPDQRIKHLLNAYGATDLPSPIWATTTESNLIMTVRNVIRHLLDEHRRISAGETPQ